MLALQITINGQSYCETDEITALTIVAELMKRGRSDRVSIYAASDDERIHWLGAHLGIGDEIRVCIIDAADVVDSGPGGCDFCGRSIQEFQRLVQGLDVSICDQCAAAFAVSVKDSVALPLGASIRDGSGQSCGFCRKQGGDIAGVVVRNGAAICPECLRACADIMMSP
jgi:hypothetical protein